MFSTKLHNFSKPVIQKLSKIDRNRVFSKLNQGILILTLMIYLSYVLALMIYLLIPIILKIKKFPVDIGVMHLFKLILIKI